MSVHGRRIMYDVKNKPSKERMGRTNIFERTWSDNGEEDTQLGHLLKVRGGKYAAIMVKDGDEVKVGDFETRSQGGHAIRKKYFEDAA